MARTTIKQPTGIPEVDEDTELAEIAAEGHALNFLIPEVNWLRLQEYAVAMDLASVSDVCRLAIDEFLKASEVRARLDREAAIALAQERDRRQRQMTYK